MDQPDPGSEKSSKNNASPASGSASTSGNLTFAELNLYYTNLSASPTVNWFDLDARENDATNDARKDTYWRIFVPTGATGSCNGSVIFGAVKAGV